MRTMIRKLYYGEMSDSDNLIGKEERKRRKELDEWEKAYDTLLKSLTSEQEEFFNKWEKSDAGQWSEEVALAYERGFRRGALFIIDVYNEHLDD